MNLLKGKRKSLVNKTNTSSIRNGLSSVNNLTCVYIKDRIVFKINKKKTPFQMHSLYLFIYVKQRNAPCLGFLSSFFSLIYTYRVATGRKL